MTLATFFEKRDDDSLVPIIWHRFRFPNFLYDLAEPWNSNVRAALQKFGRYAILFGSSANIFNRRTTFRNSSTPRRLLMLKFWECLNIKFSQFPFWCRRLKLMDTSHCSLSPFNCLVNFPYLRRNNPKGDEGVGTISILSLYICLFWKLRLTSEPSFHLPCIQQER